MTIVPTASVIYHGSVSANGDATAATLMCASHVPITPRKNSFLFILPRKYGSMLLMV